ncbi:lipid IV(A) 3-deoxy-D-manno-octulosonic acid transferase [Photobacterium lucens]|uniref:lipid IV(A) 3-deoxy-D-manno-octulosonic acid transferase n=1 Tax=Photobacterium lucens TaxID=2562949 RepID=UPI00136B3A09|nr:lipid IV(A) 3-deoxy-D-manno-octulosonic acid transferase [Photobacterium lucens]MBP2699267.1 3-deoxy-D-manno-octulosonic acid transferase [Vibrio parahaemolyticus]MZG55741.1 3-deoxy-D-manno-octulosonic acid transferase [Photobacterium lucens]MZG82282.1 3-deoxy-D-manno-octulosonic acid transferase [Photobacterium lucens]
MLLRIVYTLLLAFVSPLLLFGLYKHKPGKPRFGERWKEHFGFTPAINGKSPIWIHAASVGESIAITPLIKALKEQYPTQAIVVTTTTSTGAEQIAKLGDLVEHRYMPIDFAWCVQGFLNAVNPKLMLIVEKELWLNTLATVKKQHIPIVITNARLSERSAKRYQSATFFTKPLLKNVDSILCLHQDDAQRFIDIGATKEKVTVTGSIKYDLTIAPTVFEHATQLRSQLGQTRPVLIAASTHKGEDEQVFSAFKTILQHNENALLIIVPRHPERFNDVEIMAKEQFQLSVHRRTDKEPFSPQSQVYLADTMGEMLLLLASSDVTFMGGSLIGDKVGGHNLLEPAAVGKPAITGPSYYNFIDITEQLLQANAIELCQDSTELAKQVIALFNNPERQQVMGENGKKVVEQNQGAVQRTIDSITNYLH